MTTRKTTLSNMLFLAGFLLLAGPVLSGCNTAAGFGRDVEATGDAIEGAAEETKENLSD